MILRVWHGAGRHMRRVMLELVAVWISELLMSRMVLIFKRPRSLCWHFSGRQKVYQVIYITGLYLLNNKYYSYTPFKILARIFFFWILTTFIVYLVAVTHMRLWYYQTRVFRSWFTTCQWEIRFDLKGLLPWNIAFFLYNLFVVTSLFVIKVGQPWNLLEIWETV